MRFGQVLFQNKKRRKNLELFILILSFVFVIGLCVGSFLNVVILRAFSNESIALPPSKCPKCEKALKWYHNIPVLSYLFLRGKCGFCKEGISLQYPIVELITGLMFVAVVLKFEFSVNTLFMLAFVSLFIVLSATDIKEQVVFDFHTYFLVILGLVYNFFNVSNLYPGQKILALGSLSIGVNNSFIAAILGIILGIVLMEALARFGYLVAGTRAFGEGDTYIAAALGAIFGWKYLISILILSFIVQMVLTIPVFFKKLICQKDYKTLFSFILFFFVALVFKWFNSVTSNMVVFLLLLILLTGVGFYSCRRILGGLKGKDGKANEQNMTYLPFGPAMIVGALMVIFFLL